MEVNNLSPTGYILDSALRCSYELDGQVSALRADSLAALDPGAICLKTGLF